MLALSQSVLNAGQLRITSWDLKQPEGATPQSIQKETVEAIELLAPDVVLLQHAPNFEGCLRLAELLKPLEYQVLSCSTLRDASNHVFLNQQVAILARKPGKLSWSEPWTLSPANPEDSRFGYAFAVLTQGKTTLGIASVSCGTVEASPAVLEIQSKKLVETIAATRTWESNRPQSLIIAGCLRQTGLEIRSAESKLFAAAVKMGFQKCLDWIPSGTVTKEGESPKQDSIAFIYSKDVSGVKNLVFSQIPSGFEKPVTCDVTFETQTVKSLPSLIANKPISVEPQLKETNSAITPSGLLVSSNLQTVSPPPSQAKLKPLAKDVFSQPKEPWSWPKVLLISAIGLICIVATIFITRKTFKPIESPVVWTQPDSSIKGGLAAKTSAISNLPLPRELSESDRHGVVSHMLQWMKNKLMQQLLSERAQFAKSQQAATLAVIKMDERLTQVEANIRKRNEEYEHRIAILMNELAVAHEENRELIRAKIEALKAEMQKASKKEDPPSLHKRN